MTRTILKWGGRVVAAVAVLTVLVILGAAVTDRPDAGAQPVDRGAPEVVDFFEAERTWMAHNGLEAVEHVVEVDDPRLRVRVLEVGAGPPVVVLPPATGEAARFAPLLAELDGYRLLLVDLPGGGGSDGVDLRAVGHRGLARDTLDAVYDEFGLDTVPIVAGSLGGTWALWYGLDRPGRVTAAVQLGVPLGLEGTTVPPVLGILGVPGMNRIFAATLMPSAAPEGAADGFALAFGHPDETVEALPRPALEFEYALEQLPNHRLSWRSLGQDSFRFAGLGGWKPDVEVGLDELADLDHPTLLVWPSNDPFGDADTGHEIAARLPDADIHVVSGGHLPWLDDPSGMGAITDAFLRDNAGTAPDGHGALPVQRGHRQASRSPSRRCRWRCSAPVGASARARW